LLPATNKESGHFHHKDRDLKIHTALVIRPYTRLAKLVYIDSTLTFLDSSSHGQGIRTLKYLLQQDGDINTHKSPRQDAKLASIEMVQ
jgi:hypothetical protein